MFKSQYFNLLILMVLIVQLSACTAYKNIPYFKGVPQDEQAYAKGISMDLTTYQQIKIQPNDVLSVDIRTIDPDVNVALGSTSATNEKGITNEIAAAATGYLVDAEGNIELPIAGKIKVGGLSTAEAKEEVRLKAQEYYKQPVVNVRIINFKVTVLGEVHRPGSYLINGEKATILDALGQAGDLSIFGTRTNVILTRQELGKQKMVRFDLTDTTLFQSPYYYLKQGDVLYVQPTKGKAASNDGALMRTYAIITSTLSLFIVAAGRLL